MKTDIPFFREECRKYFHYLSQKENLLLEKERMEYLSLSVHSPSFHEIHCISCRDRSPVKWLERKQQLEEQILTLQRKIEWIHSCFLHLEDSGDACLIWKHYVERESLDSLSETVHILPKSLHRRITKDLESYLP